MSISPWRHAILPSLIILTDSRGEYCTALEDMTLMGHATVSLGVATLTRAVSYSEVASVTLLAWDILTTISDEVELVWMRQWTPAKGLYVVVRYLPCVFQLTLLAINTGGTTGLRFTVNQCRGWMIFQAIILQLVITTVDTLLVLRVYALYNKSRTLLITLCTVLLVEVAYLSTNLAMVTPMLRLSADCFVVSSPSMFVVYWIVSLTFETLLFAMTLVKFFLAIQGGWGMRPIMREFVSDGTWAYALIFVTMLTNSLLYKSAHSPLAGVCFTWLFTVLSFAGSRLILNPRRRNDQRVPREQFSENSSIEFITIPLTPLSLSPSSPVYPGSASLPSPSRKSKLSLPGSYDSANRRSARTIPATLRYPSSQFPIDISLQGHVWHEAAGQITFGETQTTSTGRSDVGVAI